MRGYRTSVTSERVDTCPSTRHVVVTVVVVAVVVVDVVADVAEVVGAVVVVVGSKSKT